MIRIILLFIFIFILEACSSEKKQVNFTFDNGDILTTNNFSFVTKKGSVFISLRDESEKEMVFSEKISEVSLNIGDTIYVGNGVLRDYSREINQNPFVYLLENKNGGVASMKINGEELIFIGFDKDISNSLKGIEFEELK